MAHLVPKQPGLVGVTDAMYLSHRIEINVNPKSIRGQERRTLPTSGQERGEDANYPRGMRAVVEQVTIRVWSTANCQAENIWG